MARRVNDEDDPLLGAQRETVDPATVRALMDCAALYLTDLEQVEDIMAENAHKLNTEVPEHFYIPDWRRYLVRSPPYVSPLIALNDLIQRFPFD